MRVARLHLRLLVVGLVALIAVPTLGRVGADRVGGGTSTAVAFVADAVESDTPEPAAVEPEGAEPEGEEPREVADTRDADDGVTAPAEVQQAPAPEKGNAPAPAEDAPAETRAQELLAQDAADAPPAGEKKARKPQKAKAAAKGEGGDRRAARAVAAAAPAGKVRSLYLGIGHGRHTDGTWQPGAEHPRSGAFEVDANRIMVEGMRQVLEGAPNLELHYEGGNNHPNMIGSVARANALGVDDCIEVHQDTAAAPPGAFVHWYEGADSAKRLADRVVTALIDEGTGFRPDWHRARSGLYFLRKSECRSILVEVGRVGDFDTKQLRQLGRAMAEAYLADTAKMRGVAAG